MIHEKRERKKGRKRDIEREGEIREREREVNGIESWKGYREREWKGKSYLQSAVSIH